VQYVIVALGQQHLARQNHLANVDRDTQFFAEFARNGFGQGFAPVAVAAGQRKNILPAVLVAHEQDFGLVLEIAPDQSRRTNFHGGDMRNERSVYGLANIRASP